MTNEELDALENELVTGFRGCPFPRVTSVMGTAAAAIQELRDFLKRHGFVECDIPACNCGQWHARFGLTERMQEIKDALSDAGHPLTNDNGNLVLNALKELIQSRDNANTALTAAYEKLDRGADFDRTVGTDFNEGAQR